MSQPIIALSDINLAEARRQLKDIMPFKGDPETLHTFISRVDYVISLYQTNDVRQQRILLGAIERNLDGQITRSLGLPNVEDWPTLKARLIAEFKIQTPNYKLLENFRETPYRGSLRAFCEEAERRRQLLISKLHLEGNQSDFLIYIQGIKESIKILIRKLPIQLFTILAHHDITDLRSLITIAQNEGIYEEHINFEFYEKPEYRNKNSNSNQNSKTQKFNTNVQTQNRPSYSQYSQPFQPNFNQYIQPFRPSYTQQITNNPPMWHAPNYFRPNQYINPQPIIQKNHFQQYPNKAQFPQTTHFRGNTYPRLQQPSTYKNTNFPITKRLRPSDSEQTKMSIDEIRFQDAHEFEQVQPNYYEQQYFNQNQYNPYQNHSFINEGQQQVQFVQINNKQNQNNSELNENFRLTVPENTNT
uniref:Retrovirus-related Gag polyprotein from transposon 297 n=1 Tax=Drosophila melanogaster TaxID=7227 RepID=GAG2_DROME|nr:RecName: Full=Retrovirus-related Gag polyprotein from transposon 297 [Drosophila melanogaster]CAA27159.1 unnamed protein product [Drosophila melanogaster]